ncbi:MAG: hypothetical protein NC483_05485 [Ruminococcus sp.]|nr:hypothetical protein [Ruminococcus sp.]
MNNLRIYLKKYSKILKLIGISLALGLIIGFFIYHKIDNTLIFEELTNIKETLNNHHLNYLLLHFVVISLLITSSITIIGSISFVFYFLFEGISISYNLLTLWHVYRFKGLIYSTLYLIITKLIFIILLIFVFIRILNIIRLILTKKEIDIKTSIYHNLKKALITIFLIFLNDLFIYFFASIILSKLLFIIS